MTSADDDFGGLSSILVSADGSRFVAVSDEAHWATGSLEYEDGNLVRAVGGMIAPLRDLNGAALTGKAGDAEGLASTSGNDTSGDLLVSFEGNHRIWRYPFAKDGILAVPVNVPIPPEVHGAPYNGGIEGLTLLADNMFIGITERYRNAVGDYRGWILWLEKPAANPTSRPISVRPILPFVMTDLRRLPDGDLLTLERRYSADEGVGVQFRRIPRASVEAIAEGGPRVPLDGEIVAGFDESYEIDNMEGLAVRSGDRGEVLVYAVSDDNFNRSVQSTLLLMYELLP